MRTNGISMKIGNLGFCLAALLAAPCQADWLSVCDHQPQDVLTQPAAGYRTHAWDVQGRVTLLQVTPEPPALANCQLHELKGDVGAVSWASLIPPMGADTTRLILQGDEQNGRFAVSEVILPQAEAPAPRVVTPSLPVSSEAKHAETLPRTRAAWFWSPARWLEAPEKIFASQQENGLRRIYITVPVEQGAVRHPDELAAFIRQAHLRDLAVWAVFGDATSVLPEGRESSAQMASAYAAFNRQSEARLDGLQLDIEPYLLPGYRLDPSGWQVRYLDAVRYIHAAAPQLALDLALPFWWGAEAGGGQAFLAGLAGTVDSLTVMDYRTNAAEIIRFAEPFLEWGQRHRKKVFVALEALHIPDEGRRHFQSASSGELWHFVLAGREVLLLLDKPARLAQGRGFRFTHSSRFAGSSVSFYGRTPELMALLPSLEGHFKKWTSFAGMALHGLE